MNSNQTLSIGKADWWSVLIYVLLVAMGWLNIYSVTGGGSDGGLFDLGQRYGMQMVWIGVSVFIAITIMLIDDKYYHMLAYPAYLLSILLLIAVLFIGREVNGAKAWIYIGSVAIQPTEFVKFTTALALARYMSHYQFSVRSFREVAVAFAIIGIPAAIIILQHDMGSAVVYAAFMLVMFREGLNGWVFTSIIMAVLLFIFSLVLTPFTVLTGLILTCVIGEGMANGRWRSKVIYLSALALCTIVIYFGSGLIFAQPFTLFVSLLISVLASVVFVVMYAYRNRLRNVFGYLALFLCSLVFTSSVDYVFDNVVEIHQQKRILDVLGLEQDLSKWGYNVNQSKIAIGSGGFAGKGYMEGTQTRFDFVPEQSTDFIFCTVGEEWGFLGSALVVSLLFALVLRLVRMAERQHEVFKRVYIYSVAAIFLFHIVINIGMTIGIMPVIGIPLPFFSYGGSSLLAFTILLFVAIKMDTSNRDVF